MVTIFVPTTLINVISFATFYFKWFDFQNRIMVSLTALLVLSTLFAQTADSLPKTSYVKIIDIWFAGSILFSFVIIIIHTVVEVNHHYVSPTQTSEAEAPTPTHLRKPITVRDVSSIETRKAKPHPYKRAISIDKYGCICSTCLYVIFIITFWIIAFAQKIIESTKTIEVDEGSVTGYPD